MTSKTLRMLLLAGLALPIGFATATLAQDHPAAGPPGDHMMMRHMEDDPAARAARAERHAQHLRDALQLRPEQEPALHALLDSMKPPGGDHDGHGDGMGHEHGEGEGLTTPQRLDKMLAHMDEMRGHMAAHAEAVKRFYAQLSPAQQKAFDAMGPMMMHGGHGGMGHGMGMGGMEERNIIIRHGGDGHGDPMENGQAHH
jgi:protein CpxP